MADEYPLAWPENWPRSSKRGGSQFRTSLSAALKNVRDEVRRFATDSGVAVEGLVISSNVTLSSQRPADPGVAVYFQWDDIATCIAVDRYEKVEDNLQAIAKVIEAERTKMRHGGLNLVRAAFRGYGMLPPPDSGASKRDWWDVLEVKRDASEQAIENAWKRLRKDRHPDYGGTTEAFHELRAAYDKAKRQRGDGRA